MKITTNHNYQSIKDELHAELTKRWTEDLDRLVDHLDAFLELRIEAEFDELKADLAKLLEVHQPSQG